MTKIVLLLEEPSMAVLLEGFLPRIFPDAIFQCIPHEGKSDLERSIPRKLRAWLEPGVRFVILRDNDGQDCISLKERLRCLCEQGGKPDALVRIVCQELEAWYLGDPDALAEAYGRENLRNIGRRRGFRDPDALQRPAERLGSIIPEFQKIAGARLMSRHLSRERNTSASFRVFLNGIDRIIRSEHGSQS